ncbi:hypothetical protein Fot_35184 [Forsythia ovata]|uniref:Uncharacterized protein n=1 Tax=Forsythia ovata TaxID=205694 RepID=A0ABD1SKT2_9LAMI
MPSPPPKPATKPPQNLSHHYTHLTIIVAAITTNKNLKTTTSTVVTAAAGYKKLFRPSLSLRYSSKRKLNPIETGKDLKKEEAAEVVSAKRGVKEDRSDRI